MENNKIILIGTFVTDFTFAYETKKGKFYKAIVENKIETTKSVKTCYLPIIAMERNIPHGFLDENEVDCVIGEKAKINGSISGKSRNGHLIISVRANEIEFINKDTKDVNEVELKGYFCRINKRRETPFKKVITDTVVACNYGVKGNVVSDYIPCIFWSSYNASILETVDIKEHIKVNITGKLHSREYQKKIGDEVLDKTTYEMSVDEWGFCDEN